MQEKHSDVDSLILLVCWPALMATALDMWGPLRILERKVLYEQNK